MRGKGAQVIGNRLLIADVCKDVVEQWERCLICRDGNARL